MRAAAFVAAQSRFRRRPAGFSPLLAVDRSGLGHALCSPAAGSMAGIFLAGLLALVGLAVTREGGWTGGLTHLLRFPLTSTRPSR